MAFWGDSLDSRSFQPKQKNRFIVQIGDGGLMISLSTIDKPKVSIESKSFRMINHDYNYPGVPRWQPITMKFVDNQSWGTTPDNITGVIKKQTSQALWEMLLSSGYITPSIYQSIKAGEPSPGTGVPVVSPEKASMNANAFGSGGESESTFYIKQIDPEGKSVEQWRLYNPIITEISWGDLDYSSDELVEYTLEVVYDWAELTTDDGTEVTTEQIEASWGG